MRPHIPLLAALVTQGTVVHRMSSTAPTRGGREVMRSHFPRPAALVTQVTVGPFSRAFAPISEVIARRLTR